MEVPGTSFDFGGPVSATFMKGAPTPLTPGTWGIAVIGLDATGYATASSINLGAGNNDAVYDVFEVDWPGTPRSDFTWQPSSPTGKAPFSVSFTDTSSGNPTAWTWDFGTGVGSTQQNPTHTFVLPGTYPVTLRAANATGPGLAKLVESLVVVTP